MIALLMVGCGVTPAPTVGATPPADGRTVVHHGTRHLQYDVSIDIDAPREVVWTLLTDADALPRWNSTVDSLEGTIAVGSVVTLVPRVAPDQEFALTVSELDAPARMVWEDGNAAFRGVRTWTLTETASGGTRFVMSEALSGAMFGMIESSLPDFAPEFEAYAADLKTAAEAAGPVVSR